MIKYLVFDFDGTLADTFKTVKKIVKEEITEISDKDFELMRENGIKGVLKKKRIPIQKLPGMVLRITSKLKDKRDIKLFSGIPSIIKILSKSYKLGIVSSNSEENIKRTLKRYRISEFFEFIFPQSSIFGKQIVLKKMCKKYKINPKETIYLGDEDRDILAAKRTKIKNIVVTWGYNSKKKLKETNPDYTIDSPKEILKILD